MKICVLRSGSSGNCTYIEHDGFRMLLDAGGMSQRRLREVLKEIDLEPENLNALLVTHTHSDHVNYSALKICEKCNIAVYLHEVNADVLGNIVGSKLMSRIKLVKFGDNPFEIDQKIQVTPFEVSHDAPKITNGFSILDEHGKAITYAADLGYFPESLAPKFNNASIIFLEANHDLKLLWNNPRRPYVHKKRVAGIFGHLSNEQTATALLRIFDKSEMMPLSIVLCHLSQDHNSPELALEKIGEILDKEGVAIPMNVAPRHQRTSFFEL